MSNATETPPEIAEEHQTEHPGPHRRHAPVADEHAIPKDLHKPSNVLVIVMALVFVVLLAGLFVVGWLPHERAAEQAAADAQAVQASEAPIVSVANPRPQAANKEISLPCSVNANQQTAIFARANGFLKQWLVDIGGHVKKDQLLAVIDAPDLDAQLAQAKATLEQAKASVVKAQADLQETQTDYQRYLTAQKENPGSVSAEDLDMKRDAYDDAAAAVEVAKATVVQDAASVQQLAVEQGFERITAPFAGTITARNYDVGALISPSNTSAGSEMFDIADTSILRVNVNVPQVYATDVRIGQPAYLTVRNYPKRRFEGVVARQTGALDTSTRELLFQLDFPNPDGALDVGMYGTASLPTSNPQPVLVVPTSSLIFNANGVQVALVRDGKVHFQKVTVGRDLGTDLEITDGVSTSDQVVTNPGEKLGEGLTVQVDKPRD
jgi:RND family efflux transporter MFP subunit